MNGLLLAGFLAFSSLVAAQVTPSPSFQPGAFKFINTFDFYSTSENFGEDGEKSALSSGNEYSNWTADFSLRYGWSTRLEVYGGLRFSNASSISNQIERTKNAISDAHLGAFYRWREGALSIYPGLYASFPLVSNALDTDSVLLNEGASVFGVPVYADYKMKFMALYGQLIPALVGDGRGARYWYSVGAKKRIGLVIFNLELSGMNQIGDDEFTDSISTRTDVVNRVNGGSLRYFSVNPGVTRLVLQARMRVSKEFIAGLGYGQDISGVRTSAGSSIFTYIEMRFSSSARNDEPRTYYVDEKRRRGRKRSTRAEEVETVYVDEDGVVIPNEELPPEVLYGENVDFQSNFEASAEDKGLEHFENADPTKPQRKKRKKKRRSYQY